MAVSPEDIEEELPKAAAIVDVASQVLDQMSPF